MTRALLVIAALLAAACTTGDLDDVWAKPGVGTQQTSRDEFECQRQAAADAPRTINVFVGGVADAVRAVEDELLRQRTFGKCMRARGYAQTH